MTAHADGRILLVAYAWRRNGVRVILKSAADSASAAGWKGDGVTELIHIPLEGGGYIVAEVDGSEIPGDSVVLAAHEPGKTIAQFTNSLEAGLRSVRPAVTGLMEALKDSMPDSIGVEFGINIGGETGVILAKGTAGVNFKVVMEWKRGEATAGVPRADHD